MPGQSIVEDDDFEAAEAYEFRVTENSGEYEDEVTVRVRCKGADSKTRIGCIESGAVVLTDCEIDGSYLKFKMDKPGSFVILKKKTPAAVYIIIILAAAAAAIGIFIFIRKKKQGSSDGQDDRGETQDEITEGENGGKTQE